MRLITVTLITFFLIIGCKSNPTTLKDAMGDCSTKVEVLSSYGDTIRLKFNVSEALSADDIAAQWCKEQNKLYSKNTMNCNGCCTSTYLCKSK
jgi:hypothetical protein